MATVRGGDAVKAKLDKLAKALAKPATLRVGFLEGARYPDGTPVALIAAVQNFGAPSVGIPPRPFFSNMVRDKQSEWGPAIAALMVEHDYDAETVLRLTGEAIAGQLRQSIRDTNQPPLAPATIQRKGFSKPLIESSQMINSVDYEVNIK